MEPRDLTFEDIKVGDHTSFSHTITEQDILDFARISGDENPLHIDEEYARVTRFGRRIAHGMFLGALCSRLLGMYLPGKRCLYLSQDLQFKNPAFIGDTVLVSSEVFAKSQSTKIIDIMIKIVREDKILAEGLAKTQII